MHCAHKVREGKSQLVRGLELALLLPQKASESKTNTETDKVADMQIKCEVQKCESEGANSLKAQCSYGWPACLTDRDRDPPLPQLVKAPQFCVPHQIPSYTAVCPAHQLVAPYPYLRYTASPPFIFSMPCSSDVPCAQLPPQVAENCLRL